MNFEKRLAKLIMLSQKLREESFDEEKIEYPQCRNFYKLTMYEAAEIAVKQLSFDESMAQPIYLMNRYVWNDIQDWANKILDD
jgi:hypothetical protein